MSADKDKNSEKAASPSRRRWLKGLGAIGGVLALRGATAAPASVAGANSPVAGAHSPVGDAKSAVADVNSPGTLSPDERWQRQPFYGPRQAGITTPQQAAMMLVAFDVLAGDKDDLRRLCRVLTDRIAFLTTGGQAPAVDEKLPPMDSGILGEHIAPDNLTMTVAVGDSLFDDRFGLAALKPRRLQKMTRFANDALDADLCHGDLLLQICANGGDTVIHALRDIIKHTPDLLSVRWKREGFISANAARSKGKETPINLLGFKDGTGNPNTRDPGLMDRVIWVGAGSDEPAWAVNGSYQAARIIRFHVESWDRTPLHEQQTIFGRDKRTGAPLGMADEHEVPDYSRDPHGAVIPLDAHMRLANPRTPATQGNLMLRRGYSYSLGASRSGQLDMGLLFVCFQRDLEQGFLAVQRRLNGEALEEYIQPIGGGYFFALPGVEHQDGYLAQGLLA